MRFFLSQARKPIRLPSNARKRRAATKWHATECRRRYCGAKVGSPVISARCFVRMNMKNRPMIMIDGQIIVALAAAFLLGIVFGSGLEILVRGGR